MNRLAVVAFEQGWGKAFAKAAYRRWFLERKDVSEESELRVVLHALDRNPDALLSVVDLPPAHEVLAANTQAARTLGIFGALTFAVGREIFWGDDRLDDALAWELRRLRSSSPG